MELRVQGSGKLHCELQTGPLKQLARIQLHLSKMYIQQVFASVRNNVSISAQSQGLIMQVDPHLCAADLFCTRCDSCRSVMPTPQALRVLCKHRRAAQMEA